MTNEEHERLSAFLRALAAEAAELNKDFSILFTDQIPDPVAKSLKKAQRDGVNALMEIVRSRLRYDVIDGKTKLVQLDEEIPLPKSGDVPEDTPSEPDDSANDEKPADEERQKARMRRQMAKTGPRGAQPVLGMEIDSGMIVEFPSVTEAAKAVSPETASVPACNVGNRAERMTRELWEKGPAAIMHENKRNWYTFHGWAFIYKDYMDDDHEGEQPPEEGEKIIGMELVTGKVMTFPNAVAAIWALFNVTDHKKASNLSASIRAVVKRMTPEIWKMGHKRILHETPSNMQYRGWTFIAADKIAGLEEL